MPMAPRSISRETLRAYIRCCVDGPAGIQLITDVSGTSTFQSEVGKPVGDSCMGGIVAITRIVITGTAHTPEFPLKHRSQDSADSVANCTEANNGSRHHGNTRKGRGDRHEHSMHGYISLFLIHIIIPIWISRHSVFWPSFPRPSALASVYAWFHLRTIAPWRRQWSFATIL